MDQLDIVEKKGSSYVLLEIQGTINSYTYNDFQAKLANYVGKTALCLDMSKVTNLASAGLGVLMTAHEDCEAVGKALYIFKPSEVVRLALQSTGFLQSFNVIANLTEIQ
jgi:anti-sigma B factor antagonist